MNKIIKEITNFSKIGIIVLIIDMLWINIYMKKHFRELVFNIQGDNLNLKMIPAIISYFLIIFSIYYFIIKENKLYLDSFILGIIIYGVFEATSMAIFKKWDYYTLVLDTLWGGILYVISFALYKKIDILTQY
jgi:uncharacterized membrane protein